MTTTVTGSASVTLTLPDSMNGPTGPAGADGVAGPVGPAGPPGPPPDLNALAATLAPLVAAILAGNTTTGGNPPPPPPGALWLYWDGVFSGPGEYDFGNQPYSIVLNNPAVGASGPVDVLVTGDGAWQPRWPNDNVDTTGYGFFTVSIKPTQNSGWVAGMEGVGDVAIPGNKGLVNLLNYGPNPAVLGQWNKYKVPLSAFGTVPFKAYKVAIFQQGTTSPSTNKTEIDAVGLLVS